MIFIQTIDIRVMFLKSNLVFMHVIAIASLKLMATAMTTVACGDYNSIVVAVFVGR